MFTKVMTICLVTTLESGVRSTIVVIIVIIIIQAPIVDKVVTMLPLSSRQLCTRLSHCCRRGARGYSKSAATPCGNPRRLLIPCSSACVRFCSGSTTSGGRRSAAAAAAAGGCGTAGGGTGGSCAACSNRPR